MRDLDVQALFVRWLCHLSERSARLYIYASNLTADAPRLDHQPLPVLTQLLADIRELAIAVQRRGAMVRSLEEIGDPEAALLYSGTLSYLGRFQSLHNRLSSLPRDWIRSEVRLFLRSADDALSDDARALIGGSKLDKSLSVVGTPTFNFANLILQPDKAYEDVTEGSRDSTSHLLTLPLIEQYNPLFWPNLLHEIGHAIYRSGADAELEYEMAATGALDVSLPPREQDRAKWMYEEIFCDLFAARIGGPLYYISLASFATFWVQKPIQLMDRMHPSPLMRLLYLREFLERTHKPLMSLLVQWLGRFSDERGVLDFHLNPDPIQLQGNDPRNPQIDGVVKLARLIAETRTFRKLFVPRAQTSQEKFDELQKRFAQGEFIGTSRTSRRTRPITLSEVEQDFEAVVKQLEETSNTAFDILMATSCHYHGVLSKSVLAFYLERNLQSFFDYYASTFFRRELDGDMFLREACDLIRASDASITRSLEISELAVFYRAPPGAKSPDQHAL